MEGGSKERGPANRAGVANRGIDHLGKTVAPKDVVAWEHTCAGVILIVWTPAERAFVVVEYVVIVGGTTLSLTKVFLEMPKNLSSMALRNMVAAGRRIVLSFRMFGGVGRLKRKWRLIRFYGQLQMGLKVDEEVSKFVPNNCMSPASDCTAHLN